MSHLCAGIDIGSTMTKVVIIGDEIVSSIISTTRPEQRRLANLVMEQALKKAGVSLDSLDYVVSTGYGRLNVPFSDRQITEITCHARGVSYFFPDAEMLIDIGGQDSKAIRIESGRPVDFVMNDKCAAGTGRFIEIISDALGIGVQDMALTADRSTSPARISNLCTIFAEQEVAEKLATGVRLEDIAAGILDSLATRVAGLARRLGIPERVVVTGGAAKNSTFVHMISKKLERDVMVPEEPLLTGAAGAAVIGRDLVSKSASQGKVLEQKRDGLREIEIL